MNDEVEAGFLEGMGLSFSFNGFFALDALAVLRGIEFMAIHASKSIFFGQFLISILGVSLNGGSGTPKNTSK